MRGVVAFDWSRRVALAAVVTALTVGLSLSQRRNELVLAESILFQIALPTRLKPPSAAIGFPFEVPADQYSPSLARRVLVPTMGGSIAVGDYDGDDRLDLYVVVPGASNTLLRNGVDGRFRDVTARAKVGGLTDSVAATFSDYDHSHHPSLFVTGASGLTLYHNNGNGTFSDVTRRAGLQSKTGDLFTRAVLADLDSDGFPDLLATVYTDFRSPPTKASIAFPNDFRGGVCRLYKNNQRGVFVDVTGTSGLVANPGRARNAVVADFNSDGRADLLILRDDKPPALLLNQGGLKFEDATWDAGEALTRHAFFDALVADFNRDGKPDLALWSTMSFGVLLNSGNAVFEQAESIPLLSPLVSPFGFHGTVADFDGNGFDDLVSVDKDGRWHFFANQGGRFQEKAVILPLGSGTEAASAAEPGLRAFSSVCPMQLSGHGGLYLVGLRPDGRITALR